MEQIAHSYKHKMATFMFKVTNFPVDEARVARELHRYDNPAVTFKRDLVPGQLVLSWENAQKALSELSYF